jgi:hypothetical protein
MPITYEPIATTTVSSASATVTLSSISGSYTDLILIVQGTLSSGGTGSINIRVNGDTGSNYSATQLDGNGSSAASYRETSQTSANLGILSGASECNSIFHFQNYANNTTYKTMLARGNNGAGYVRAAVGLWRSTAAINSISIFNPATTYAVGTTLSLYGIKAA